MKLFYAPGSSSLLPHIVLHEAELRFEPVKIDEHTKAILGGGDYRSVNPLGYVPALVLDDGTLLTEGAAIVQYIADLVPGKKLAPANGTIERVKLQGWLNFFASEMHKGGFSPLFYKGVQEESRDIFRARLRARFSHLDGHLSSNEYLMGRDYSVADAHFFVVSNWASWVNFDLSPYRAVLAYRQRVGARPAVVAALTAEGLVPWPAPHLIDTAHLDDRGQSAKNGSFRAISPSPLTPEVHSGFPGFMNRPRHRSLPCKRSDKVAHVAEAQQVCGFASVCFERFSVQIALGADFHV